ncbi:MAG: formate dehydrogenase subunit delta [Actinomycetes bacterium]
MDVNKLVYMALQIEKNLPDHDNLHTKLAAHLESFWAPAMRGQLYDYVNAHRDDFSEHFLRAVDDLHAQAKA